MDKYTRMRLSGRDDEEVIDDYDMTFLDREKEKDFNTKYKEFFNDVKTNIKEDW